MKIDIGDPLISLDNDIVADLSSDPYYYYQITKTIRSSHISNNCGALEVGPVN